MTNAQTASRFFTASLASLLLASACSAGGDTVPQADGTGGAPMIPSSCSPGIQNCFCPDGTASGKQTCDAQGQLSPCVCPLAPGQTAQPPPPPPPTVTKLCPALAGSRTCNT